MLLIYTRRVSMMTLFGALLWAWSYCLTKGWEPWPANIAVIAAVDFMLLVRAITLRYRIRSVINNKLRRSFNERSVRAF